MQRPKVDVRCLPLHSLVYLFIEVNLSLTLDLTISQLPQEPVVSVFQRWDDRPSPNLPSFLQILGSQILVSHCTSRTLFTGPLAPLSKGPITSPYHHTGVTLLPQELWGTDDI